MKSYSSYIQHQHLLFYIYVNAPPPPPRFASQFHESNNNNKSGLHAFKERSGLAVGSPTSRHLQTTFLFL